MEIEKIKSHINNLLNDLKEYLHEEDFIEIEHYLKYNELKISMEMLVEFISESELEIPRLTVEKINSLLKQLDIEEHFWLDLP